LTESGQIANALKLFCEDGDRRRAWGVKVAADLKNRQLLWERTWNGAEAAGQFLTPFSWPAASPGSGRP